MRHSYKNELDPASDPDEASEQGDSESEEDEPYRKAKRKRSDQDLRTQIWSALEEFKAPNAFAFSAVNSFLPNPGLNLPPHGALGLPLSTDDARKIILQARQSPFGKGEETVIDTSVRKCWELNPNQFLIKNPEWDKAMEIIIGTACTGLGIQKGTGEVQAELHKLLLYEPGSFFKPHKDSEKAPGMFGTLVVCLPSTHEGGKLVLTHDNEKYEFDSADSSSYSTSYAAWYSDITHEVLPITSGYRLVLTYNLILKTNFEVPSYDMVLGRFQHLSMLFEQFASRLEEGVHNLPPILLHKLKHKYTEASLRFKSLKPQDLAQVEMLKQVAAKVGFDIYLATLELVVESDDCAPDEKYESQYLQNVVYLDGELVVEKLTCPKDALIDPRPQGIGKADSEHHEGPTGNEGCPATFWYRDTVVVLVPPSKQIDFAFEFNSTKTVIAPLFHRLIQKYLKDEAQKPKVEELCERALNLENRGWYCDDKLVTNNPGVHQAAATALDLGRFDLFDKACRKLGNRIIPDNARLLGRWTAKNGLVSMSDRLMKGAVIASTVAKKVDYLKSVAKGFEAAAPKPSSAEIESLKQWSDEALFSAVAKLDDLTEADAIFLARLPKSMDWSLFESKLTPVLLKTSMMVKVIFVNELMSTLKQVLVNEPKSFLEKVVHSIWDKFNFNAVQVQNKGGKNYLNEADLNNIIRNTVNILSCESIETTVIPAMLTAIPSASKNSADDLFISLVRKILKGELEGFKLPSNDAVPPSSHKRIIQAFLTKFLVEFVGHEPDAPTDWSITDYPCSCSCNDCSTVSKFLQDSFRESFDFQCPLARRTHLSKIFKDSKRAFFVINTIKNTKTYIWRITKRPRSAKMVVWPAKTKWIERTKTAAQTLTKLEKEELVKGRLEEYLQPYYSIIMNVNIKELPDLKSLVPLSESSEASENTPPTPSTNSDISLLSIDNSASSDASPTGNKRGAGEIDFLFDGLPKRTKSGLESDEDEVRDFS